MKFKTIYLIILAIFFLGIVIYDLFTKTNNISYKEGFNTENLNVKSAIALLKYRIRKDNPNGLPDKTILEDIGRLGSYGEDDLNAKVANILKSSDTPEVQADKLAEIFGVPSYEPLNDSLVIYYDFKNIDNTDPIQPVIPNKSPSSYTVDASTFDAKVILGVNNQTTFGSILESTNSIINDSHLNLLGGNGLPLTSKNGAYLLFNNSPTFYNNGSFLGFTFSAWVNTNNSTGYNSRIFDFGNGRGYENIIITNTWYEYPGIGFFMLIRGAWKQVVLRTNILNNKWVHIVWTVSVDGEWKIYMNNELLCEKEVYAIPINVNRKICYIGKSHWSQDGLYNGKMADFRIYQREISAEDVNTLYNKGNVKGNELPERKGVNLIKNGSFSSPKINSFFGGVTPNKWSVTRQALIWNIPNNNFSGNSGLDPKFGYANQLAILSNFGTNFTPGYILQNEVKVARNIKYEFSFVYVLYNHPNASKPSNDIYLTVKLGCYIDAGADKSILPKSQGQWQKYTTTFTTDSTCEGDETLRITLNSPKEGNVETSCGITCISLRKLNNVNVSDVAPAGYPGK